MVRSLVEREGLPPERVIVVVNGSGGSRRRIAGGPVRMVRLPHNLGPAGGFGAGMAAAFADPSVHWAYLCEDDVGLFSLPSPRLADIVGQGREQRSAARDPWGRLSPTGAGSWVEDPTRSIWSLPQGAPRSWFPSMWPAGGRRWWRRRVFDAGIVPDAEWFFGLRGLRLLLSGARRAVSRCSSTPSRRRAVADQQTSAGRDEALGLQRPTDESESWRSYYHSRNSILLARRHGRPSWHVWHLAYAARHLQKATGRDQRRAILRGLWDGALGRFGENPEYGRTQGELAEPNDDRAASA